MVKEALSIGQVAKQAGVSVETVRFYEREGLLERPERKQSGYRRYSLEIVRRLKFIRRAKTLGFSLNEIRELLALRRAPETTCGEIKNHLQGKVTNIEEKIEALLQIKRVLLDLSVTCSGAGSLDLCPILNALDAPSIENDKPV